MSYLIKKSSYYFTTKEITVKDEIECEGEFSGDNSLIKILANTCLQDFLKKVELEVDRVK